MTTAQPTAGRAPGRLPDDPHAFIKAAEHNSNVQDLEANCAPYAQDVVYEQITDGVQERHTGWAAVHAAWRIYFDVARDTGLHIEKTIITTGDDVIVNEWRGRQRDGRSIAGMEFWRFDADGRVAEHRMFQFLNVK